MQRFIARKQDEFGLLFPVCNDPLAVDRAIAALPKVKRRAHLIVRLPASCRDPLPLLQTAQKKRRGLPAAIHVVGLGESLPSNGSDISILHALNLRRGQWEKLGCPVLLWVPEWLLGLILRHAADFANWRSGSPTIASATTATGETLLTSSAKDSGSSTGDTDLLAVRSLRLARLAELQTRLVRRPLDFTLLAELTRIHARENQPEECFDRLRQAWQLCHTTRDFRALHNLLYDLPDLWASTGLLEHSEKAANLLQDSARIRSFLEPQEPNWQRDLSISHNKLGDIALSQGKLDEAARRFAAGLAVAESLAAADPGNTQWQRYLSISHNRLGDVAVAQGKLDEAARRYASGLAVAESLAAADPGNTQWQRDLSISHNKLGNVAVAQGKLDEAARRYAAGLAVRESLAEADPGNTQWQRDLFVSHWNLADLAEKQSDSATARRHWQAAHDVLDGIDRRGLHISPEDREVLGQLKDRLGLSS